MVSQRDAEYRETPSFRGRRVYRAKGHWFFDSREGPQFGPFRDQDEAVRALAVFIAQHADESSASGVGGGTAPGAQDGIDHMVLEVSEMLHCYRDYGARAARTWALSRLEDLQDGDAADPRIRERIGVLRFALEHAEQTFDFGSFLEHHARPTIVQTP
jgi:hypothetical protein